MAKIIRFPAPVGGFRAGALAVAFGSVAFGLASFLAPRWFARTAGLPIAGSPGGEVAIRSVGTRDTIIGLGIWSAVTHGGKVAPWLLARGVSDATDAAGVLLAWTQGARSPRFFGLGAIALAAAIADFTLYAWAKSRRLAEAERPAERPAQIDA